MGKNDMRNKKTSIFGPMALATTVVVSTVLASISPMANAVISDDQQVTVKVSNSAPPIDVILSKGQTSMPLNNFKTDLINKIANDGYDTSRINVQEIKAVQKDVKNSFYWNQNRTLAGFPINTQASIDYNIAYGNVYDYSSWGHFINRNAKFTSNSNGTSFLLEGNPKSAGSGLDWVNLPTTSSTQKFGFDYNLVFGDNFKSAGMVLSTKEDGDNVVGTVLVLSNPDVLGVSSGIGTFSYPKSGGNSAQFNYTSKQVFNLPKQGSMDITVKPGQIDINAVGTGSDVGTNVAKSFTGGNISQPGSGFGFYSDQYLHNCGRIGSFTFQNLSLEETNEKSLTQVLQEPTFSPNSSKVVVNVSDAIEKDLLNPNTKAALATRLMSENIHYIAWGKDNNLSHNQDLLKLNDHKGLTTTDPDYLNNIKTTAEYIERNFYKDTVSDQDYVVVDKPISINVDPASARTGTQNTKYPDGRWMITYDSKHFYNSMGEYPKNKQYVTDLPVTLSQVGKYTISFADKTVKTMYVHRLPTAAFNFRYCPRVNGANCIINGKQFSQGEIELTSYSSDADADPKTWSGNLGTGITEEKWEYRYLNQDVWSIGKPTLNKSTEPLQVRLAVKDAQGEWSESVVKTISDTTVEPVSEFVYQNPTITVGDKINIIDTSYSPNGKTLNNYNWVLQKKSDSSWVNVGSWNAPTNNTSELKTAFNPVNTEAGTYRYTLKVTDISGLLSKPFTREFTVLTDTTKPTIINSALGSTSKWYHEGFPMETTYSDAGTGLSKQGYIINTNPTAPGPSKLADYTNTTAESVRNSTPNTSGKYYLHAYAYDKAGNDQFSTFGPFQIDGIAPTGKCTAQWSATDSNKTVVNCAGTDDMSGVNKWINGKTSLTGNNVSFPVDTSPGAMTVLEDDNANNQVNVLVTATPQIQLTNPLVKSKVNDADNTIAVSVTATNRTPLIHTLNNVSVKANNVALTCQDTSLTPNESTTCSGNIPTSSIK